MKTILQLSILFAFYSSYGQSTLFYDNLEPQLFSSPDIALSDAQSSVSTALYTNTRFNSVLVSRALASQAQTKDTILPKPVVFPAGYVAKLDVVYTKVNGWEGRADLYISPTSSKPTPLVINIHGGGWKNGKKESQSGFNTFFNAGFAVANMEYRLSGQAKAPAAVEDTRCMLIYLIKNAKELNIDVNKIVIMGGSAGGHLALMGGLLANDHRFDTNCPGVENIKVAAIIDKYGITDVWDWTFGPESKSPSPKLWLGENVKNENFIKSVSPIYYVNKNSPPIFIVHGDSDQIVTYQQSVTLYNRLQQLGVKSQLITVPGGLHGKFDKEMNNAINESLIEFLKSINLFN